MTPPVGPSAVSQEISDDRLIGNALLTNTTVCEASRFLLKADKDYDPEADGLRVFDLVSLIDAVILHERIFYLPASLPDDVGGLEFRNCLVESDILAPLPKGEGHDLVGQALLASLSTTDGFHKVTDSWGEKEGTPLSFENFRQRLTDELSESDIGPSPWDLCRVDENYDTSRIGAGAKSFDEAAQDLIGWLDYSSSGAYEESSNSFRAMYYTFASEHYHLPYLASASVAAGQQRFPNYFHPSVVEKIYQQLASGLQGTWNKVAQEFDGPIVSIPPFSALVLDRAATPAGIASEMLALRSEYSDFRRKMCELERARLEARSLNDRLKVLRQIERLGKEVTRPFDQPSQMKLETALRYIPDAAELATNPTNPAGWARVLLGLPTEALISWYRRRPVAKLVRTARTIKAMPDYDRLLTKHFGSPVLEGALGVQELNERLPNWAKR
jgi:hypothetical protein